METEICFGFLLIPVVVILAEGETASACTKLLVQAEAVSPSANVTTTGIDISPKQISVSIFPNPADNILTVQLAELSDAAITLTDIEGKVVMQKLVSQNQFQLDISSLPKATYFLNIKTAKGQFNQKILKQ